MSWIYPERWPGWADHTRVGGSLFDDTSQFVQIIQNCWEHYCQSSGVTKRIPLSPPPKLKVTFQKATLDEHAWHPFFACMLELFHPQINGFPIEFELATLPEEDTSLPNIRNFFFQIDSPQRQKLDGFFFLGQQPVGVISLGEVNLVGDQRIMAVHRRLGFTKSSDILNCFNASPLGQQMPNDMQQDLRYLGWTFAFREELGQIKCFLQDIPKMGFLKGGELLVREGDNFPLGEAFDFYQGLTEGAPDPALRCRFILVPEGTQPTPSLLEKLEIFTHHHPEHPTQLEFRAWVTGSALQNDQLILVNPQTSQKVHLKALHHQVDEQQTYYQGWLEVFEPPKQTIQFWQPEGLNLYGLSFPPNSTKEVTLRQTTLLRYQESSILQKDQLKQEWELRILLEGEAPYPDFDLAAFTLWLRFDDLPPVQLPLASVDQNRLLFRYLPRSIGLQVPINKLEKAQKVQLWLEQAQYPHQPFPEHEWKILEVGNRPEQPLKSLRIVDFDTGCRLLPSNQTIACPAHEEIVLEGHRLQMLQNLPFTNIHTGRKEPWSLLLAQPKQGHRRLMVLYHSPGWMLITSSLPVQSQRATSDISNVPGSMQKTLRSLWFSCGTVDRLLEEKSTPELRKRSPNGGPCMTFGLGLGQTNEMAQLRATEDGFRVYRHRQHIQVFVDDYALPVEPYQDATGHLLSHKKKFGWLLIDRALLRYRIIRTSEAFRLELTLLGYLFKQDPQQPSIMVQSGQSKSHPATTQADAFRVSFQLPGQGSGTQLKLFPPAPNTDESLGQLLLQENHPEALPEALQHGKSYTKGPLSLAFWEGRFFENPNFPTPSDRPANPSLFVELQRPYGRKRFHLSKQHGRLGYWSQGSVFLQNARFSSPIYAPDHPRVLQEELQIPAGELIVGCDLTQADLLIPGYFGLSGRVYFSLGNAENRITIRPLEAPCYPLKLQKHQGGQLFLREGNPLREAQEIEPSTGNRIHFRCGHVIFELSKHSQECSELPNTDLSLSILGVFHPTQEPCVIGGPPQNTPVPILDPIPNIDEHQPLFHLFYPALYLRHKGNALVGLRQPAPQSALLDQLLQKLREAPGKTHFSAENPIQILEQLDTQRYTKEASSFQAPDSIHTEDNALPEAFVTEGSTLHSGLASLRYTFRKREEGHPSLDIIPAKWEWTQPISLKVQHSKEESGFLLADQTPVEQLIVGRQDPSIPQEAPKHTHPGELYLSESYTAQDKSSAKIVLHGYAPRMAFSLTRREGQLFLQVPPPKHQDHYHLVIEGKPYRKQALLPIEQPVDLHINHLLVCRILPHPERVEFQLTAYLLSHQQDPGLPVELSKFNRAGHIHLQSIPEDFTAQLQPEVCPPHFRKDIGTDEQPHIVLRTNLEGLESGEQLYLADHKTWPLASQFIQPEQTDRMLWFEQSEESHFSFSFTKEQTPKKAQHIPDEGSSFSFGPPSKPAEPITEEIIEPKSKELRIGCFSPENEHQEIFGVLHSHATQCVSIRIHEEQFVLSPTQDDPSQTADAGSGIPAYAGIWRSGDWLPLQNPQVLRKGDLIICGLAAFAVKDLLAKQTHLPATQQGPQILLQRQWLWLPTRKEVVLCGQEHFVNELNSQKGSRLQVAQPTDPQRYWLGLIDSHEQEICQIAPVQRGHRLSVQGQGKAIYASHHHLELLQETQES